MLSSIQAPHKRSDPALLPGKNTTVLTDQAQTQDDEKLQRAKSVYHFGNAPWQLRTALATGSLGNLSCCSQKPCSSSLEEPFSR